MSTIHDEEGLILHTTKAMLIKAETLRDYTLENAEGGIGPVSELYFDDDWTIRYLATDTRKWTGCKRVIIPTDTLTGGIDTKRNIKTSLTNQQVHEVPSPARVRRKTRGELRHLSPPDGRPIPFYREGILSWKTPTTRDQTLEESPDPAQGILRVDGFNLRGIREVTGYQLRAADGNIGVIADFIIDIETWNIRFLIIDPRYWWLGSKIAVTPDWTKKLRWSEGSLSAPLPRKAVQVAPVPRGGLAFHS